MTPSTVTCRHVDCTAPARYRGICRPHYDAALASGIRAALHSIYPTYRKGTRMTSAMTARVEDLTWLLDTGTPILDAVRRTGWSTPQYAERSLRRAGAHELAYRVATLNLARVGQTAA